VISTMNRFLHICLVIFVLFVLCLHSTALAQSSDWVYSPYAQYLTNDTTIPPPIGEPADAALSCFRHDTIYVFIMPTGQLYIWLRPDPLMDENIDLSPYVYCHGNPLVRIDPDGRADYYDIDGNHLCNDGVADNRVFQQNQEGDVVLGGYAIPFSYVGDVDKISLSYEGTMVDGKNQSVGDLIVSQHVGDKVFNQTFSAVSGNSKAYTLQNGVYSCSSFRYRSASEANGGYYNNGYGFSINLNPSFTTMRKDLRIHPDGGAQGTLGCIGLTGGASELKQFVRTVTPFVPADPQNTSILLTVVVTGNPGCFKAADGPSPALFR